MLKSHQSLTFVRKTGEYTWIGKCDDNYGGGNDPRFSPSPAVYETM